MRFRLASVRAITLLVTFILLAGAAFAQTTPRPARKGRKMKVKIESSPQQAAIYLDDKVYGIVGYTPYTGTLVQGKYKVIIELQGFRASEQEVTFSAKTKGVNVTLEKIPVVSIQANDPNVNGAQVFIDGQPQGTAPLPIETTPGRHLVELKKPGFDNFQEWVQVMAGDRVTMSPLLKAQLVVGDAAIDVDTPDAEIWVDGKPVPQKSPAILSLSEGRHYVEAKKGGATTGAWVDVKGGARAQVSLKLAGSGKGSVRVVANIPGAEVWLDGAPRGPAPLDLTDVASGVHLVEVRAKGYANKEERVTVVNGQNVVLKVDLGISGPAAKVRIVSPQPGAQVFVDGADLGKSPVETELAAGDHFVVVEAEGIPKFERKITVESGKDMVVTAEAKAVGGLRFLANVEGAEVVVDGEIVGRTPLVKQDIPVGDHVITIRAEGYADDERPMKVEPGKLLLVNAELAKRQTGPSADEVGEIRRGLTSFGARTMPPGRFSADLGAGYPYFLEGRATVGVLEQEALGLDVGVQFRSLLTTWEFMLIGRTRLFQSGPFAFGAFAAAGGGGGFNGRNEFTFQGGGLASITFQNLVTVTGRLYFDVWSDRLCGTPERRDSDNIPNDGPTVCTTEASAEQLSRAAEVLDKDVSGPLDLQSRDTGVRGYISLAVEAALMPHLGVYGIFEGPPFQGERAAYTDVFNAQMLEKDQGYVFHGGVTAKF